jgi:RNA polymerase sigma factor (sigma-70 family)
MAISPLSRVIEHLRRDSLFPEHSRQSDTELLEAFLVRREEAAFEALVRRHGPMILGVCRRILLDRHSAEDAFQATFMVFIQKASSISKREHLANWLYGVALRTSLQARTQAARRRIKERGVIDVAHKQVDADEAMQEMLPLLDHELSRLPDKYRLPIILCDLQGQSRKEAAQKLKLPEGTLSTRLARARRMLAKKLARHGIPLSGAAVGVALGQNVASASMPNGLVASTVKAGLLFAAGEAIGTLSVTVSALTEKVVKTMLLTKLKNAITVLVIVAVLGIGAGAFGCFALADNKVETKFEGQKQANEQRKNADDGVNAKKRPKTEKRSGHLQLEKIDLEKGIITGSAINTDAERTIHSFLLGGGSWELLVRPTTKITIDGKEAKLADLRTITPEPGSSDGWLKIIFAEWEYEIVEGKKDRIMKGNAIRLEGIGVQVRGIIQSRNSGKNSITTKLIHNGFSGDFVADTETEVNVAKDVQVKIDDKAATFDDLKPNMKVTLQKSAVKELVLGIKAYGAKVDGVLKSVDAEKNTVSVNILNAQMTAEQVSVAKDAKVVIDGKEGKLSDLKTGMRVTLQMSAEPEQSLIVGVTKEKAARKER